MNILNLAMDESSDGVSPRKHIFVNFILGAFCAMAFLGIVTPRILAFLPGFVALLGWVLHRWAYGYWPRFHLAACLWALGLGALLILSSLWSIAPDLTLERSIKILPVFLGGALLISLFRELDRSVLSNLAFYFPWAVILGGLICAVDLLFKAPITSLFRDVGTLRISENYYFLNRGVVCFTLFSFLALFMLQLQQWQGAMTTRKTITTVLLIGLLALVLTFTASQSSQLAIVLAAAVYFLFPANRPKAWWGLAVLVAGLIILAPFLAMFLFSAAAPMVDQMPWLKNGYAASRMEIWDFVARRALESPLWGHGAEATQAIEDFDTKKLFYDSQTVLHPHNFALQLWIEFGALGAILGVFFIADIIKNMASSAAAAQKLQLAVFIAALSIAATGYGLWQGWWIGLLGMLAAYGMLANRLVDIDHKNL
jgi:O-antigen ligase